MAAAAQSSEHKSRSELSKTNSAKSQDRPSQTSSTLDSESEELWDLALSVSGYDDVEVRRQVLRSIFEKTRPMLEAISVRNSAADKARALLHGLHGAQGILKKYNARATTLKELVNNGEFNCLSASVVFALLAQQLDVKVVGELLPSHARILIKDSGRTYRVETTSPEGFDPSPQVLKRILAQSVGADNFRSRSLVDARGAETTSRLLIALIYVNRASIAQEQGQLRLAEQLFQRGEGLANDARMRKILREQRAALLSQLGANDMMSAVPKRQLRAFQTMIRSSQLKPEEPLIKEAVHQNLRASAERVIAKWAMEDKDESKILSVHEQALAAGLPSADAAGLLAFAYSEIARLRARNVDYDGALEAMDLAMAQSLAPRDTKLKNSLLQNHVAALRLAAMTSAKSGAYAKSMRMIERLLNMRGLTSTQRREYEADRKRAMLLVAEKAMSDQNYSEAAVIYRSGRRLYPEDPTIKHNLIAALERESLRIIDAGRCERVSQLLREIHALDSKENFSQPARLRCLLTRANRRLQKNDYSEAVAWLETARKTYPKSDLLRENLVVAYMKWIQFEVQNGKCRRAVHVRARLNQVHNHGVSRAKIDAVLDECISPK